MGQFTAHNYFTHTHTGKSIWFNLMIILVYSPTLSSFQENFFNSLTGTDLIITFFILAILMTCTVVLISISLMTNNVKHLMIWGHLVSLQIFAHFSLGFSPFSCWFVEDWLIVWFMEFFGYQSWMDIWIANIFSHSVSSFLLSKWCFFVNRSL